MNTSGIKIKGVRVLVRPFDVKGTFGDLIQMPDDMKAREELAATEGILVDVGQCAWQEEIAAGRGPDAEVGDHVIFARYAGQTREGKDGNKYRIINDEDIIAVMEKTS